jgi:hypothetical protein
MANDLNLTNKWTTYMDLKNAQVNLWMDLINSVHFYYVHVH